MPHNNPTPGKQKGREKRFSLGFDNFLGIFVLRFCYSGYSYVEELKTGRENLHHVPEKDRHMEVPRNTQPVAKGNREKVGLGRVRK